MIEEGEYIVIEIRVPLHENYDNTKKKIDPK